MSTKTTVLLATGILAVIGTLAAVSAQSPRGSWRGVEMGERGFGSPGGPGFGDRFRAALTKDEFDARSRERFARLDRNADGVVDAAEIEASVTERTSAWGKMRGRVADRGSKLGERMLHMYDTNKDGKVTRDEYLAGIRKQFAEMDLNNDGRITDDDLPPIMRGRNVLAGGDVAGGGAMRRGGRGNDAFPLLQLLRGADANKDGVITLDEVLAAADKRFQLLDRNKDGAIDTADFNALRKEMTDYRVQRFIHHFGADKDGKVTREQFMAKAQDRFAQMDLNNDGVINADERPGRGRWFGRGHRGADEGRGRGPDQGGPGGMGGPGGPGGMGRPGGERDQSGPRRGPSEK